MNALTDLSALLKKPEQLNCRYFAVYSSEIAEKNKLFDNYSDSNAVIESATNQLSSFVQELQQSGCNIEIWFSDTPKPSKGGFRVKFFQNPNASVSVNPSVGSVNIGTVSKEEAERIADERFNSLMAKYKSEQAIEELKKQNLELQRKVKELTPTGLDRISERLIPYIGPIMEALNIKKAVVESMQKNDTNHQNDEQQQKDAEEALTDLAKDDPDFVNKLKKLAKLKKENPALYNMAVTQLG
ncbi:MAG: hypothetical protein HXX16_17290 [Bacteroidales bacterium]|nr:hypothetical protein [Bacteroidales bacterium]